MSLRIEMVSVENAIVSSWRRAAEINLLGPPFATEPLLPNIEYASRAAVVHVSLIDGLLGTRKCRSKHGRRVANDLTPQGRACEADVHGITHKIKSAYQLSDQHLAELHQMLEMLSRLRIGGPHMLSALSVPPAFYLIQRRKQA